MSGEALRTLTACYFGGPLDGLEVEVPTGGHQWARYTDPATGTQHFYELVWRADAYVYVHRHERRQP